MKEMIQASEQAVSGMQDESLKRAAFEAILSRLLSGDTPSPTGPVRKQKKAASKRKPGTTNPGSGRVRAATRISSLELDAAQLKALKEFYDHYAPDGQEEAVFTLAYFAHDKLAMKQFQDVDLHRLYTTLLSLKPTTKPPSMSAEEVTRASRWLVAPSRKKQWLKSVGEGIFEVSPHGMLRMTYDA